MGKRFCKIESKWCKFLKHNDTCNVAKCSLADITKCPRVAEIETTTLASILKDVEFEPVFERLCKWYPREERNKSGYESVFNMLLTLTPKKSHNLNDTFIAAELTQYPSDDIPCLDIYGTKPKNDTVRYGMEFCPWVDWVSMFITQESLDNFSKEDIVAGCLYEMTFFGFTEENISNELKKMEDNITELIKKREQNPLNGI